MTPDMEAKLFEAIGEMRADIRQIKADGIEMRADIATLKARPARSWGAVGKWFAGITATVIAAVLAFKLKVVGR